MKQYLIATELGLAAFALRDRLRVTWAGWTQSEALACLANDALATRLVTRLCRPKMVFVDVGAHIGSVIAQVMRHCPTVRIEAVEACAAKCRSLTHRFPRVKVHAFAAGDADGGFVEYFEFAHRSGFNTTVRPSAALAAQAVVTRVPVRTLDSLIGDEDVDVLKIDVEGAEAQVLEGGRRILEHSRPTVMFESTPDPYPQSRARMTRVFEWFERRGYGVLVPDRLANLDDGLNLSGFLDSHVHPRRTTNYFAVPKERRAELRVRAREILGLDRRSS